jgi:hypothetical protein
MSLGLGGEDLQALTGRLKRLNQSEKEQLRLVLTSITSRMAIEKSRLNVRRKKAKEKIVSKVTAIVMLPKKKDGSVKKSPKAPKSDTPEKNPKGVGKGGKLSPKIIKSIETKVRTYNEKYPDKKIGVGAAKRVVLRGMGAYNTSHSPKVTSAIQWGLARLNAFMYLVKNGKPSNPKYTQDNDLLPKWHKKANK